jgi:hypothetical protein
MTTNLATSLGIHRDGTTLKLDCIETEQRRRCWATIAMLEALQASAFGRPCMMRSIHSDAKLPSDVNDIDILRDQILPPSSRPTQMTYINLKFRLLSLTARIAEINFSTVRPAYSDVLELDVTIRRETARWGISYGDPSLSEVDQRTLHNHHQAHWYILHGHLHQMFLLLHRPFFQLRNPEPEYEVSRKQCLESAFIILQVFRVLLKEERYRPYKWYTNGLAAFHTFHAAVVMSMYLLSTPYDSLNLERTQAWDGLNEIVTQFEAVVKKSPIAAKALPVVIVLRYDQRSPALL